MLPLATVFYPKLLLITHKSLTRFLQLSTGVTYLLTEPMTHDEQLKVMGVCRGAGLGPISFHPDGRVVIYSQAPIADKVSLVFPNSRILEILPLPLDTPQYRFQITFIPDRDQPCEVLRFAHG